MSEVKLKPCPFCGREATTSIVISRGNLTDSIRFLIRYIIDYKDGISSCGYDNDFLAVAWLCNGKIELKTVLLERM